jgi:hypothetical protein
VVNLGFEKVFWQLKFFYVVQQLDTGMIEPASALPTLQRDSHPGFERQSSGTGQLTRSRYSLSSLWSCASDNQIPRVRRAFKAVSYMVENRQSSNQDILKRYQKLIRIYSTRVDSIIENRRQIEASMEREVQHMMEKTREVQAYQAKIQRSLEFLSFSENGRARPPTLWQIKRICDAICKEGIRFKELSDRVEKVETEAAGIAPKIVPLVCQRSDNVEHDLNCLKNKLAHNVLNQEEAKMKRESAKANHDTLVKMIFEYKTALETTRIQKQALQIESDRLADEFHDSLDNASHIIGTILWRMETATGCDKIAGMEKFI